MFDFESDFIKKRCSISNIFLTQSYIYYKYLDIKSSKLLSLVSLVKLLFIGRSKFGVSNRSLRSSDILVIEILLFNVSSIILLLLSTTFLFY